jgi:hypothetical protein
VVVVTLIVTVAARILSEGYSPDYRGAPVEASDAVPGEVVVAFEDTVAYSVEPAWVGAEGLVDLTALSRGLPADSAVVGAYFTDDPAAGVDEFVALVTFPAASPAQPLDVGLDGFLHGATDATGGTITKAPQYFITDKRLEGFDATYVGSVQGIDFDVRSAILGHGDTTVIVTWMSYDGAVDEEGFQALLESIRIDD